MYWIYSPSICQDSSTERDIRLTVKQQRWWTTVKPILDLQAKRAA